MKKLNPNAYQPKPSESLAWLIGYLLEEWIAFSKLILKTVCSVKPFLTF